MTDLTGWGLRPFGAPLDALTLDIVALGGERDLERQPLGTATWDAYPMPGRPASPGDQDRTALVKHLTTLRDRLEEQAQASGWELPKRHA